MAERYEVPIGTIEADGRFLVDADLIPGPITSDVGAAIGELTLRAIRGGARAVIVSRCPGDCGDDTCGGRRVWIRAGLVGVDFQAITRARAELAAALREPAPPSRPGPAAAARALRAVCDDEEPSGA